MTRFLAALVALFTLAAAPAAAQQRPAGFVTGLDLPEGAPAPVLRRQGEALDVQVWRELFDGDALEISGKASVTIETAKDKRLVVDAARSPHRIEGELGGGGKFATFAATLGELFKSKPEKTPANLVGRSNDAAPRLLPGRSDEPQIVVPGQPIWVGWQGGTAPFTVEIRGQTGKRKRDLQALAVANGCGQRGETDRAGGRGGTSDAGDPRRRRAGDARASHHARRGSHAALDSRGGADGGVRHVGPCGVSAEAVSASMGFPCRRHGGGPERRTGASPARLRPERRTLHMSARRIALLAGVAATLLGGAAEARTRGLVFGVSAYPHFAADRQLRAPKNDVKRMLKALAARGVAQGDLAILADDVAGSRGEPTRAAILAGLDRLGEEAERGDLVIIYGSGHGSRQAAKAARKADGLEQLFLPRDAAVNDGGAEPFRNAIRAPEFGERIDRIRARGADVWFILDSCFSGSASRAFGEGVRDKQIDPAEIGVAFAAALAPDAATPLAEQPAPPPGSGKLAAFYASQPNETAREVALPPNLPLEKRAWGSIFTLALAQALERSRGLTYRQTLVEAGRILRADPAFQARQTPSFEGDGMDGAAPGATGAAEAALARRRRRRFRRQPRRAGGGRRGGALRQRRGAGRQADGAGAGERGRTLAGAPRRAESRLRQGRLPDGPEKSPRCRKRPMRAWRGPRRGRR
jgi:hypothetical protein